MFSVTVLPSGTGFALVHGVQSLLVAVRPTWTRAPVQGRSLGAEVPHGAYLALT
jgi:hypothetical protein